MTLQIRVGENPKILESVRAPICSQPPEDDEPQIWEAAMPSSFPPHTLQTQ